MQHFGLLLVEEHISAGFSSETRITHGFYRSIQQHQRYPCFSEWCPRSACHLEYRNQLRALDGALRLPFSYQGATPDGPLAQPRAACERPT